MQPHCLVRPVENSNIDYETINQAYCNLIAGAALAMGLRFAGTANNQAFETLFALTKKLMAVSKRSVKYVRLGVIQQLRGQNFAIF